MPIGPIAAFPATDRANTPPLAALHPVVYAYAPQNILPLFPPICNPGELFSIFFRILLTLYLPHGPYLYPLLCIYDLLECDLFFSDFFNP